MHFLLKQYDYSLVSLICLFLIVYKGVKPCDLGPCQNGGNCYNRDDDGTYFCVCSADYTGFNCDSRELSYRKLTSTVKN